jgi:hypothetical protein
MMALWFLAASVGAMALCEALRHEMVEKEGEIRLRETLSKASRSPVDAF